MMIPAGLAALTALNLVTFLVYWHDKRAARSRGWRVPESRLLLLAALGGSPAALAACHVLRHKTSKQPFRGALLVLSLAQLAALVLISGWLVVAGALQS